jgi:hypothetical protein
MSFRIDAFSDRTFRRYRMQSCHDDTFRKQSMKRHFGGGVLVAKMLCMVRDTRGQATVEAAFALPILMILVLLLLQPGIVLYDRLIMQNAANEGLRLLTTSSYAGLADSGLKSQEKLNEEFVRRRLSAIPQASLFHVHDDDCSYEIYLEGDETSKTLKVTIRNEIQPLPLIGSLASIAGLCNERGNLVIEVTASQSSQPDWLLKDSESLDPGSWTKGG